MLFWPREFCAWRAQHDRVRQRSCGKVNGFSRACLPVHKGSLGITHSPPPPHTDTQGPGPADIFRLVQILRLFYKTLATRPSSNLFNLDLTVQSHGTPHYLPRDMFNLGLLWSMYCQLAGSWHSTEMPSCYWHLGVITGDFSNSFTWGPILHPSSALTSSGAHRSGRFPSYIHTFLLTIGKEVDDSYVGMWTVNCCRRRMLPS